MNKPRYIVIRAEAIELLETRVNEAIKNGYVPQGGVTLDVNYILQAMYIPLR